MLWPTIWSITLHQGEPSDPELLHWIKDRIDSLIGLGPWIIVAVIAMLIVLIPLAGVAFYLLQQRRQAAAHHGAPGSEER